ncbi:CHAT domain-containing protein [Trichocoleus sp. ST-U3]
MFTVRITQYVEGKPDHYRIEIVLEGNGSRQTSTAYFAFKLTPQDLENIRWYLEDFLEYPQVPAPKIAVNIEQRMTEIGVELFEKVFHANDDTRQVWEKVRYHISDTRVEIVTGVSDAAAIPWELIRDSQSNMPLALGACAFVRTTPQAVQLPQIPQTTDGKIRILLVIFRPGGGSDVPFRSVATKLIKGLTDSASEVFQLDVLRPPYFARLGSVLRQAKKAGQPYHIVHFDGHGGYDKTPDQQLQKGGYLRPEDPGEKRMYGKKLGQMLKQTGVSLLVLNACRSAYAEAPTEPGKTLADDQSSALGSLAQEVMEAGIAGVVAMRYNVYVLTAAQFVADLYASLAQGQNLGEAVTQGRKQLHAQPTREIAYEPQKLQDWTVPIVYEATPVMLFPKSADIPEVTFNLSQGDAMPARGILDPQLPKPPDAGFLGRDETLLALDRAFDTQSIVLLHAYAGSGKTSTGAEFGRWYAVTGGVKGLVLFTSFERYLSLARVLDKIGQVFGDILEAKGFHWLALSDEERRDKAQQLLREVPVLWIWDNVEPVAGFPAGTESAWSSAEQQELVDFLRDAQQTQAKFLLTSRRNEQGWLGDLPCRITVLPMPMRERVQLARAVVEKYGHQLTEVEDWRPLLRYSQGNPMTITAVVGQALRNGFRTRQQIEDFVFQLRSGEAEIDDDESEGRSKSLGASLSYGFKDAFNEAECKQLALLHFFQGYVAADLLRLMGDPEQDWCLPAVRGQTLQKWIALLDRATEVGLLTKRGKSSYAIHPVLPWYFKKLLAQHYLLDLENSLQSLSRAFVEAMGVLGNHFFWEYHQGNRNAIRSLIVEESNLLYARQLARANGWWHRVADIMQGLKVLYTHTGRQSEWACLVKEIVPNFVDPVADTPLSGLEEEWSFVIGYRVQLCIKALEWGEAERLERLCLDWGLQKVSSTLDLPLEVLDSFQRGAIRSLAVSWHGLGNIQMEQDKANCVEAFKEAIGLFHYIGDQSGEASSALNLGTAYKDIPGIRNLEQAEQWYQHSLGLCDRSDRLRRGQCLGQLGRVFYERFKEAQVARQPREEQFRYLTNALQLLHQALDAFPPNAVDDLAQAHHQLGITYNELRNPNRALSHYSQAINYFEVAGNIHQSAGTRLSVAIALAQVERFNDALLYAQAALHNYETYSERAAADIQNARQLIAMIEQDLAAR